jgi:hypothetical protein
VAALRCFFRFCMESEHIEIDPAHVLRTPKKREVLPDVLDRAELARLDTPAPEGVWQRTHAGKVARWTITRPSSPGFSATASHPPSWPRRFVATPKRPASRGASA